MAKLIFITGTDTGVGKTYITGLIGYNLLAKGFKTITMKPVQTGCKYISEDIITHRQIMDIGLTKYDLDGTTNPYNFAYPASPHLSATLENKIIDIEKIFSCIRKLSDDFDYLLIEGVGGLYVPIKGRYCVIDLIKDIGAPVVLVTSPRLGTLNHTFLSLEALKNKNIPIISIIYNDYFKEEDKIKLNNIETIKDFYPDIDFFTLNDLQKMIFL